MIDNEFYKDLGDRWYTSEGDAVALLRIEKDVTTPWVLSKIREQHDIESAKALDVGCGGGFLTFALNRAGAYCTGLDMSDEVLAVGRARDPAGEIEWVKGDATDLPFADQTFDVVCLMDVLEHVFEPKRAVQEALRVLKPRGTLLTHTFNRTLMSWLFAAKGLDWFIRDSQKHIHDWRLFIKPEEMESWVREMGFEVKEYTGLRPKIASRAFVELLLTRRVPRDFEFQLGGGLNMGYLGCFRAARD